MGGAIASFNYEIWQAQFRKFTTVSQVQAQGYWNEACLLHNNTGNGPVNDPVMQQTLLNLIVAHIAFLDVGHDGNPSAASQGLVGRVSSASQGSVSLSTDMPGIGENEAFWAQSEYGIRYHRAMLPFRTFRYRPHRSSHALPW